LAGIVENILKVFDGKVDVIGTGGNVEMFMIENGFITIKDPDLTLKGIKAYYDRVKESKKSTAG